MRANIPALRTLLDGRRGVLVDRNILLDIATQDSVWGEWSENAIGEIAEHAVLIVNPIVYAEISVGYKTIEAVDAAIPSSLYQREPFPGKHVFWRANASPNTVAGEVLGARPSLISKLARTPRSGVSAC